MRFYRHYLRQVRAALLFLLLVGLAGALIGVTLFRFLGRIVDLVKDQPVAAFFAEHGKTLIGMALVVLVLRPIGPDCTTCWCTRRWRRG